MEQIHDLVRALAGDLPRDDIDGGFGLDTLRLPRDLPVSLPAQLIEHGLDVRAAEEQWHSASAAAGGIGLRPTSGARG